MEAYLIYILKSTLILSIFWGIYVLFLKRETFFYPNRWFLILGILTAILLPLVHFQRLVHVETMNALPIFNQTSSAPGAIAESTSWWTYLFYAYLVGCIGFGIQFLIELFSVKKIIQNGRLNKKIGRIKFIEVQEKTSPFSFFNTIVYNPTLHSPSELDTILQHEQIHVSQKHSVDMVFVSIAKITLWFNPISWMYKKELAQNLEYIADFESCSHPHTSEKAYQYLLLNQLSGISNSIINPFFNSLIKKRILMLQKQRSHKKRSWKYALILPFLASFMLLFSFKTQVNYLPVNQTNEVSDLNIKVQDTLPPLYVINGKEQAADFNINSVSTQDIESISVLKNESAVKRFGEAGKNGVVMIQLKAKSNFIPAPAKPTAPLAPNSPEKPLIFVDDKQMSADFDYKTIDPNTIKSMEVFKDKDATKKFGEDAKDGVIKIYTKNQKTK